VTPNTAERRDLMLRLLDLVKLPQSSILSISYGGEIEDFFATRRGSKKQQKAVSSSAAQPDLDQSARSCHANDRARTFGG
jgi:hypothetical protein